jgi:cation transport ATPase
MPFVHFETSAMIITFVLGGRTLEAPNPKLR